ncbi:Non-ribosomal peptide synthetase modules-related protein [Gordonia terrae C-6]|uniref:Non-ribosomal peptide synthetase modules-related protein n=1 Tax=Gordonia terrae C-6 TaxID=1316928 RepID=R7YFC9_9ACTN|nr:alpha/beta fold hydrolase [Gordonia terrae]EON34715.1 Non-ribosomal peptide synthetase modules-related protein [Gordonia terrae C-6]
MTIDTSRGPLAAVPTPVSAPEPDLTGGLAHAFATAADRFGDAIALRLSDTVISYRELLRAARGVAARIRDLQPTDQGPVVVQLGLSPDTVAVVLGVFLTRRPLVTLDTALPAERIDAILASLRTHGRPPGLAIADAEHMDGLRDCGTRCDLPVVETTGLLVDAASAPDTAARAIETEDTRSGSDAAFGVTNIQFTSGSTGTPKGVLQPGAMWLCDSIFMRERFGLGERLRVALCMPISFGGGLNVLMGSLLSGCDVLVADPRQGTPTDLLDMIAAEQIHTVFLTPSLLRSLVRSSTAGTVHPAWSTVRRIITTGEPLTGESATATLLLAPQATVTNWAGSSETYAIGHFDVRAGDPARTGPLPAGTPALHKTVRVERSGRVSISSRYIALGYLDPAGDVDRFSVDDNGIRTFHSGDNGRFDGEDLVLLGRADDAVKIRGYLVEPAEVSAALLSEGDLSEAVVIARENASRTIELIAYVVPEGNRRTPPTAALRARLREALPPWMVPAHIVELSDLPRNARGKIDRTALPEPRRHIEPVVGELESSVAATWAGELSLDVVGRTENIYALGADSLTIQQIMVRLNSTHRAGLTQSDMASAPTVAELATIIAARTGGSGTGSRDRRGERLAPTTIPLRRGHGRPVFYFTGAGASALTFVPFADRVGELDGVGPVFAFAPHGLDTRGIPDWTVNAAVRRHLRDLRRIQPEGPYVLVGHSLGGFIALETARRLEAEGHRVDLVVVVDTFVPPRILHRAKRADPSLTTTPVYEPLPRKELWRRRIRVPLAGVVKTSPTADAQALEELGVRVGRLHRPRPYSGRALVVQGSENRDEPSIWRRHIVTGDVDVLRLDCNHLSVVREPHIGDIVDAIDTVLRTRDR